MNKYKNTKKGFTLVELLVVIAILAVLASVSIIGYSAFLKKANISGDQTLVSQLNLHIQVSSIMEEENPITPYDVIETLKEDITTDNILTTITSGYVFGWDETTNTFILVDDKKEVVYPTIEEEYDKNKIWIFVDEYLVDFAQEGYNQYIKEGYQGETIESITGIDVGYNEEIDINYIGDKDKALVRTNGGVLTVDNELAEVYHYGTSNEVNIIACKPESYHLFAATNSLKIKKGRLIIQTEGCIESKKILVSTGNYSDVKIDYVLLDKNYDVCKETNPETSIKSNDDIIIKIIDESQAPIGDGKCEHEYENIVTVDPTCTEQGYTTKICKKCGYDFKGDFINAKGHTEVVDEAVAATCTNKGLSEGKHCSVCNAVLIKQEEAKELGHDIGEATYTWNEANTTCVAERQCKRTGCSYKENENGTVTSTITQERTNEKAEITTYTATFSNNAFITQNKEVETNGSIVSNIVNLEYNQMNQKAIDYISNVTYNSNDTTTSHIATYNYSPYTGDDPLPGTINLVAGTLTVTDGGTGVSYTESVSVGPYEFYNLTPNVDSTYIVKDAKDNILQQGTLHPTGNLRMIKLSDTTFNIRDIGGWACDGGTLNYNKIIRGSQVDNSHLYSGISFTEAEYNRNFKILNIKDEIDLRVFNSGEYGPAPTVSYFGEGVGYNQYNAVAYYAGIRQAAEGNVTTWKKIISHIASDLNNNKPIYLHCSEGADRTGTIIFLLEAICGVSESDLDKDYELTTLRAQNGPRLRTYGEYVSMKQYLNKFYGDTFRDKVVNYMLAIGVTMDEINTIRGALINSTSSKTIEQHNFFDKNAVVNADDAATHKDTVDCRTNAIIKARVSSSNLYLDAGGVTKINNVSYYQVLSALIPCSAGDKIIISSNYPIRNNSTHSGYISFFANDCSDDSLKDWDDKTINQYTKADGVKSGAILLSLSQNQTKYFEYTVPNSSNVKSFRVSIGIDGNVIDTEDIKIYVIQKGIKE